VSTAGAYALPVSYGEWQFRLDFSYRDSQYPVSAVRHLTDRFGEVGLFSARIGLDLPQYGINLALWGKNLTDEEYYDLGSYRPGAQSLAAPSSNTNVLHPAPPRTFGLEVKYEF
jgi:outer membrane receptor protein involved in Fe transport